jgi:hypothetical protein
MRIVSARLARVAVACMLASGGLAGCASAPPPTLQSTAPMTDPVFASEEEALAAATAAYAAYQSMSSHIAQGGGKSPERMSQFAIGDALEGELDSLATLEKSGFHGVGNLAFDSMRLQASDLITGRVDSYLCLDVSGTDVVGPGGISTVPADRPLRIPLQVGFTYSPQSHQLLVEKSESWTGTNFC